MSEGNDIEDVSGHGHVDMVMWKNMRSCWISNIGVPVGRLVMK